MAKHNISATDFAAKSFDYIIVGGGTAGLALAARLTENPSITVGVIEAGLDRSTIFSFVSRCCIYNFTKSPNTIGCLRQHLKYHPLVPQ
jgi:choline dehydrogenase-like flavoprotein